MMAATVVAEIDRLHAWYLEDELQAEYMEFARTTYGLYFYASLFIA